LKLLQALIDTNQSESKELTASLNEIKTYLYLLVAFS
jgi:hypothetical protein